jgi:nitroreductase
MQLTSEEAFTFLSRRRSIRNFKPDIPSQELLENILEVAGYAPGSPHHRIGWEREFIVVLGHEKMQKVLALTADYLQQTLDLLSRFFIRAAAKFDDSAKAGIAAKPDLEMRLNEYKVGRDLILYNAPAAIFAVAPTNSDFPATDCSTALYSALLLAQKYGLGSCWNGCLQTAACGDHLQGFTKLSDYLGIPKGYKCFSAATIGYPAIELHKIAQRKVEVTFK